MTKPDSGTTLKRLRSRYRLLVMNDDTYEEVVTFKLTRLSVYIALSSIFVLLVGLTVALIVFTPLKYYLPGIDGINSDKKYREMKYRVDELSKNINQQNQYLNALKKTLTDSKTVALDTTLLQVPKPELIND